MLSKFKFINLVTASLSTLVLCSHNSLSITKLSTSNDVILVHPTHKYSSLIICFVHKLRILVLYKFKYFKITKEEVVKSYMIVSYASRYSKL